MAADEPVAVLNLGIVAKIDLVEIKRPFIRAGVMSGAGAMIFILLGTFLFVKVTGPMIRKIIASEPKFRSVFESRMVGIIFWNAAGEITNANDVFLQIVGYSEDELRSGKIRWKEMTPPEYVERDELALKELAETGSTLPFEKESHSPANISDMVESTLTLIRTIIRRDQINLEVDIEENLPMIKCRSQQIQQVLMNLLTNARDALNEKYPKYNQDKLMKLLVRSFERDGSKWIRVTVEDHGTGISPENRERMFDPFFTTKDRAKGTGLGLAISHGIVKDHQGRLYFESEPPDYTRFQLELRVNNGWSASDKSRSEEGEG